jgi:hypothetical protein
MLEAGRLATISSEVRGIDAVTVENLASTGLSTKAIPTRDEVPTNSTMGMTTLLLLLMLPETSDLSTLVAESPSAVPIRTTKAKALNVEFRIWGVEEATGSAAKASRDCSAGTKSLAEMPSDDETATSPASMSVELVAVVGPL